MSRSEKGKLYVLKCVILYQLPIGEALKILIIIQNYLSCISYVYRHVQNYAELLHVETVLFERFIGLHVPQRSQVYRFLLLS